MNKILSIIDYIEVNICNDINIKDIADFSEFSLFYFIKYFNKTTHLTPFDYMIRRRLTLAAEELISSNSFIGDISIKYKFKNHETFSRSFKRMFLVSPSKIRESKYYLNFVFYKCTRLEENILLLIKNLKIKPEIVYLEKSELLGITSNQKIKDDNIFSFDEDFDDLIEIVSEKCKIERITLSDKHLFWISDYTTFNKDIIKSSTVCFKNDKKIFNPEIYSFRNLKRRKYFSFLFSGTKIELTLYIKYIFQKYLSCSDYILRFPFKIIKFEKPTFLSVNKLDCTIFLPIEER